jgi:hypothetical protein
MLVPASSHPFYQATACALDSHSIEKDCTEPGFPGESDGRDADVRKSPPGPARVQRGVRTPEAGATTAQAGRPQVLIGVIEMGVGAGVRRSRRSRFDRLRGGVRGRADGVGMHFPLSMYLAASVSVIRGSFDRRSSGSRLRWGRVGTTASWVDRLGVAGGWSAEHGRSHGGALSLKRNDPVAPR